MTISAAMRNPVLRWSLRLGGSAVFLTLLMHFLPREALLAALRSVSAAQFAAMLLAYCLIHIAAAAKWWIVLGRRIPFLLAVRTHFSGLAANLVLPGATGGDAVRAVLAHASLQDGPRVTAAATADRLIDVVSLATLALTGIVLPGHHAASLRAGLMIGVLIPAVAIAVALLPRLLPLPWQLMPKLPGRAVGEKLADAFSALGRRKFMLLFAFGASLAIQLALMALSFIPAASMAGAPTFTDWCYAWPLSKIIAFLPVSINGLGVREGAMAAMLSPTGASPATVVASGLVWQGIMFAGSGVGAAVYLISSMRSAAPAKDTAP